MPLPEHNMFFGINLSEEQREYADSIFDHTLTITDSISGSGKTTVAVGCAKILQKKLYYVFAPVQEKELGFTPGDVEEKVEKYLSPLYDALEEIGETPEKVIFTKKEFRPHAWVYPVPHTFLRGCNFKDAVVILEEVQNMTEHEIRKILTRCHDSCTVIMIGHQKQTDIPLHKSGFPKYKEAAKGQWFAKIVTLTKDYRGNLARWADNV